MKRILDRLCFRTIWQIHLRVVPVIAVGAVAIVAAGWLGWLHWSGEMNGRIQAQVLAEAAATARDRAVLAVMQVEAAHLWAAAADIPPQKAARALVETGDQAAVALPAGAAGGMVVGLAADLDTPANHRVVTRWLADRDPAKLEPVRIAVVKRPVRLTGADDLTRFLLPVTRGGQESGAAVVAFLDPRDLIPDTPELADWWSLEGPGGDVLAARGQAPPPSHTFSWQRLAPWSVSRHRAADLPFTFVCASPPGAAPGRSVAAFLLVALTMGLVLAGAALATARVVGDSSRRMAALGGNMEALARGEYTIRMPLGRHDEVGRLVSYFNLMAASLEEAHRQVNEKATDLKVALEKMHRVDQSKDEFLVLVSHEVRTPLTCILSGIQYLRTAMASVDEERARVLSDLELEEVVEVIVGNGERLNGFMTDALQMTAIQSGQRRLELESLSPADLVIPGLERVREEVAGRGIVVDDQVSGIVDWHVLGDRTILPLAVTKLVENAVIHNRDGGRVLLRPVDRVAEGDDAQALITAEGVNRLENQPTYIGWEDDELKWRLLEIHNTGPAIPADRIAALFGKFELVGQIEHHSRGSGLSLPIAQAALEQHGGRIVVRSTEETGTSFYLLLPTMEARTATPGTSALGDDLSEGLRRRARHESVGQVAHRAALDVELDDAGAAGAGELDETGSRVDGACGADHQEKVTT